MPHRGPDDAGTWVSDDRRVAFGHRRLSIVDLSAAGHQPMTNEDGTLWITYNGEIYNHAALRSELEAKGHVYRSPLGHRDDPPPLRGGGPAVRRAPPGDVRVRDLGHAPAPTLPRPRPPRRQAPLLREPARRVRLRLRDQVAARHPSITRELDEEAFVHYLTFACTPTPMTLFAGIRKLAPAERMTVTADGRMTSETYWTPFSERAAAEVAALDDAGLEERLIELLRASVGKRMMSDVPFGVFLSGGVDSSTNVALMSELMSEPVHTFSVGFAGEERYNELEWARTVARRFGTDHHEVIVEADDLESLPAGAHLPPGRADRRPGLRPALLRLEARPRQRHDRRPDRRGLGRDLPRLRLVRPHGALRALREPAAPPPGPMRRAPAARPSR